MKRYKINMTSMQWGLIAMDLGKIPEPTDSSNALRALVRLCMEHAEKPEDTDLPFNIESA